MAIDIVASDGAFGPDSESLVMRGIFDALLRAVDATDDVQVSSSIGVALHVLPASRFTMGAEPASSVRIDVVVPGIALASFRRRRRFIAEATAAVAAHSQDPSLGSRTDVRIIHCVDGGWRIGGHALTNDEMDEGPEAG